MGKQKRATWKETLLRIGTRIKRPKGLKVKKESPRLKSAP